MIKKTEREILTMERKRKMEKDKTQRERKCKQPNVSDPLHNASSLSIAGFCNACLRV